MTYRQKICLTIGIISLVSMYSISGLTISLSNKRNDGVDPILGKKQTYRPLSAYKSPEPPPVNKVSELPKERQNHLIKLKKRHESQPENIEILKALGKQLHKNKLFESCKDTLLPYLNELDQSTKSILVKCLEKRLDHRNQAKVLENMLIYEPKNYRLYTIAGDIFYILRDAEKAITHYRKAISLNPKYVAPYKRLLELFKETENTYEQRQLLTEMVKSMGEQPVFLTDLCRLYSLEAYFDQTISACLKAVRANPKIADNHVRLGIAYKESGNSDK
ncbi:MAG: hypothetical protein R2827_16680, partial [Bdellovibrionales bacterium]